MSITTESIHGLFKNYTLHINISLMNMIYEIFKVQFSKVKNAIGLYITDKRYKLPEVPIISDQMMEQVQRIKDNNYILPTVSDNHQIEEHKKNLRQPLRIIER